MVKSSCNPCPTGYYCRENTTSYLGYPCPTGYYCPDNTTESTLYPCPKGFYNPASGSDALADCLECPTGQNCDSK